MRSSNMERSLSLAASAVEVERMGAQEFEGRAGCICDAWL